MRPELKEVTMAEIDAVMSPQTPVEEPSFYSQSPLTLTGDSPGGNKRSATPEVEVIQPFQHKFEVMKLDEEELLHPTQSNHTPTPAPEENNDSRENHTILEEDEREKT